MTGSWPSKIVDHINRNRLDNRWINLRNVPRQINNLNTKLYKNNKSGYRGIYWRNDKWLARFKINKCYKHVGYFDRIEDAIEALQRAKDLPENQPNLQ